MGPGEGRAGVTGKGATKMSPKLTVGEVARLARAMTCQCASVDLFHCGAKAGILGDARSPGKERILRAFARALAHEVPRKYVFGLDQLGATVVAVSTAASWVHDPDGLDVDVTASPTARLVIEAANLPTTVDMDLAPARVLAATARGVKDHGAALAIAGSA